MNGKVKFNLCLGIYALVFLLCYACVSGYSAPTTYKFPLKNPVWVGSKILCSSWYSKWRTETIKGKSVSYQYKACNYPAKYGTDVYASGDGIVTSVVCDGYEGLNITVRYDTGLSIRVCHLSEPLVLKGRRVDANDIIGKVGQSGRVTGPHLRVVVELNGERIFCGASTWGMLKDDFYYSKKTFDQRDTKFYPGK